MPLCGDAGGGEQLVPARESEGVPLPQELVDVEAAASRSQMDTAMPHHGSTIPHRSVKVHLFQSVHATAGGMPSEC
jgi:hypothetical protein